MALAWLVLIILLSIVEMSTLSLVCIWFIIGAVGAMISSAFGADFLLQLVVFVTVSLIFLIFTRPLVKRFLKVKETRTNADRIIGEKAIVVQEINNLKFTGQVKVMGQVWTARSEEDENIFPEGETVNVVGIAGVKLIVKRIDD